jgi:CheY-like chemotaxis protein
MSLTKKVLVVDDDLPTCELISEVLSSAEIEAYGLTDSVAAALRLLQQKFDAVFLDAKMPAPDGMELARRMRASGLNKKSLIVMITGETEQQFLRRAFEAGINFVLFKPVDRQALMRLLRVTQGPIERERRRFTRVHVCCQVLMEFGQERAQGQTIDMSASGMLVHSNRRFPLNSLLKINLDLQAGKPPLRCPARVVRLVGENSMGIELEGLALEDTHVLEEFLLPHILQLADDDGKNWEEGIEGKRLAPAKQHSVAGGLS